MHSLNDASHGPLLVIVGPTGVGKTALSMVLAGQFSGEIVSADSRLFYRDMDIGTDKPSAEAQELIPHHLIDICSPDDTVTLGQYKQLAVGAIADIQARGRLPLLVGGTGQYVRAIIEGWGIPEVAPQPLLRGQLEQLGAVELQRWLEALDPESAAAIDPRNVRRVIRALEVTLVSGREMSNLQRKKAPDYRRMTVGLACDRETLYQRIDQRVDQMMADGLVEEVRDLWERGYGRNLPAMSGLGYRQVMAHLHGEMDLDQCIERIKFETHRFARQQHNWFRSDDTSIRWYDIQELDWQSRVMADIELFLLANRS